MTDPHPTGPALAVLDLDNLVSPWWEMDDEVLVEIIEVVLGALPSGATTVGACTHRVGRRVGLVDLEGRLDDFTRVRARPEAADRLLLGAVRSWEPRGPGSLWIGSGDRRFAGAAGRARREGHEVVVLAPSAGLAPQLRRKADLLLDLRRAGAVDITSD